MEGGIGELRVQGRMEGRGRRVEGGVAGDRWIGVNGFKKGWKGGPER